MGIPERREREKSERRMTILNCARDLILRKGVEGVNMEDIARKAELSKATLYLYFSGKEIIFNEICEEAAQEFLEHVEPFPGSGITGIKALKSFWSGYVKQFGNFDEMLLVFKVRHFLNPGQPFVSLEQYGKSRNVDIILETMKTIIDQCKTEKIFDPALDSDLATRLLLSMFSNSVDSAARLPAEARKSPLIIEEMKKAFQILVYGFAREGIDRSRLDITGM